jgi:hypothetical protein
MAQPMAPRCSHPYASTPNVSPAYFFSSVGLWIDLSSGRRPVRIPNRQNEQNVFVDGGSTLNAHCGSSNSSGIPGTQYKVHYQAIGAWTCWVNVWIVWFQRGIWCKRARRSDRRGVTGERWSMLLLMGYRVVGTAQLCIYSRVVSAGLGVSRDTSSDGERGRVAWIVEW